MNINNNYKKTLNLPDLKLFSMKANLIKNENIILKKWKKYNIYKKCYYFKNKKKTFLLHDGPPYANGNIHIGHAVNKILKDIIIKSKILSNYNTPYFIGWDCHGLPIELAIKKIINVNLIEKNKKFKYKFFKNCRRYVKNTINNQKDDFIKLGIFSDWKNCYYTMNFKTESEIINILGKLYNLGYIKRLYKPTNWCIKCNSSISDLELDNKNFIIKSTYIKFEIYKKDKKIFINEYKLKKKYKIFFVIWTTKIWTIYDVKALSININIKYCIIFYNEYIIISYKYYIDNIYSNNKKYIFISYINIKNITKFSVNNPINNNIIPILINKKIIEIMGTSIVMISPGHSIEDYELCKKNNIKIINNCINNKGFLNNKYIKNINIFNSINIIKNFLIKKNNIFIFKKIKEKFPYCSRHKFPIILRLTYQWFMDLEHLNLRNRAIHLSQNVNWIPKWGKEKIKNMLENRFDWCISRQKTWGVPITIFINKKTQNVHPQTNIFFNKISKLIKKYGIECWWKIRSNYFLKNYKNSKKYIKCNDILDVWFDSGASLIYTFLNEKKFIKIKQADLYLEGQDQYRGWFMSSLLIFVALNNTTPYKNILTHGFVKDNLNIKMSKSLGNALNIKDLLKIYGSDIIRLWVSYSNYKKNLKISNKTLLMISDIYKKIRNTIKFIITNLYDFDINKDLIKFNKLIKIDKWIINKLYFIQIKIINYYKNYNFRKIINLILKFIIKFLGSLYFEIIKDRLYILNKNSVSRKSCQTTLHHILESITRLISPILSFTSEEIWEKIPGKRKISVFYDSWYKKLKKFNKNEKFNEIFWKLIFKIKKKINIIVENYINSKIIKSSLETKIILITNKYLYKILLPLKNELNFIFISSFVFLEINNKKNYINNKLAKKKENYYNKYLKNLKILIIKLNNSYIKCNRCWNYYKKNIYKNKYICKRCYLNINNIFTNRTYI